MNTNRLPSGTACHYIGGREGLAEALRRFTSAPLQIIDLVVMSRDVVMGILCDLLKGEGLLL